SQFATIPFTFTFGEPFALNVIMNSSISASLAGVVPIDPLNIEAHVDFATTAFFTGALVVDASGNPRTDVTITTAAGDLFTSPSSVAEPPPAALMGLAALVMVGVCCVRGRSRLHHCRATSSMRSWDAESNHRR